MGIKIRLLEDRICSMRREGRVSGYGTAPGSCAVTAISGGWFFIVRIYRGNATRMQKAARKWRFSRYPRSSVYWKCTAFVPFAPNQPKHMWIFVDCWLHTFMHLAPESRRTRLFVFQ